MRLSEERMWEATISSDPRCDKFFYYAVRTTGIFCRPSCKSRTPNRENVQFFETVREAKDAGFRPCKRCCPDQKEGSFEPTEAIVEEARAFMNQRFEGKITLTDLSSEIGVSAYYLNRIFKERTGKTPRQFLEKVRIEEALKLLSTTSLTVTEIGYRSGFQSLSSFYAAFQRNHLASPTVFREEMANDVQI